MKRSASLLCLGLALLCHALLAGCNGEHSAARRPGGSGFDEITVDLAGQRVVLELALDDVQRARGMMYRRELEENRGMLFLYVDEHPLSFWMKNTWIPLSIAFIKDDGRIINIEEMRPHLESVSYKSREPCRIAIEMNAGWFAKHGLEAGDRIALPPEIKDLEIK